MSEHPDGTGARSDRDAPLPGSRLNPVFRVGDTVRRVAGPWTPTVHSLLRHIRDHGFDLAPLPGGLDDQGREILSYIPGDTVGDAIPWPDWVWDEGILAQMGEVTAQYHRAVAGFRPGPAAQWQWE